jgi:hypothetical protein
VLTLEGTPSKCATHSDRKASLYLTASMFLRGHSSTYLGDLSIHMSR